MIEDVTHYPHLTLTDFMLLSLAKGDTVTIELEGRQTQATIILCSANGASLAVHFDGMIGGYVMYMPLLYDDAGQRYIELVEGRMVIITKHKST